MKNWPTKSAEGPGLQAAANDEERARPLALIVGGPKQPLRDAEAL